MPGLRKEFTADAGQLHRSRGSVQKPDAKINLQFPDSPRQGGLGRMEDVRGLAEAAGVRDEDEGLDAIDVDLHSGWGRGNDPSWVWATSAYMPFLHQSRRLMPFQKARPSDDNAIVARCG